MSRYGPPAFVEDHSGDILAAALTHAADTVVARHRQAQQDREADTQRDIGQYTQGFRQSIPQADADQPPINGRAVAADPVLQRSAIEMMGRMPTSRASRQSAPAAPPPPSGPELASAFDASSSSAPSAPTRDAMPAETPLSPADFTPAGPPAGGGHPGAFDPSTKSFGGGVNGAIARATPPQRYLPLPHGGYIDTEATPRADAARDRATQLRLAAEFRSQLEGQRDNAAGTRQASKDSAASQRTAATNTSRATISADHDQRMLARMRAGEKPTMIGGNPYMKNEETGAWEPAVDDGGKPLTVADVPQKPAKPETPTQVGAEDARAMATLNAQIGSTQRQITAVNSTVSAATYAEAGSKEKKAADDALSTLPQLKQRLDSLNQVRDQRAAAQQGTKPAKGPASPVTPIADSGKAAWIKANPQQEGESVDDWRARYEKSKAPAKKPTA